MIKITKFLLFFFLFANCKKENKISVKDDVFEIKDNNIEVFIDSTNIASKGKYKIEITQKTIDTTTSVDFNLFKKVNQEWVNIQKYRLNKCCDIPLITEFSDFNNDGLNDFTIHYSTAGRGANDIRKLFLFSSKTESFFEIINSDSYPNLRYNKKLDCIDALSVYAGSTTTFLKIKNDSLIEFARVDYMDGLIQSYLIQNGKEIKLNTQKTKGEISEIIKFDNYNPIEGNLND